MAYTNIDDPSAYFQVKKWTGNAGTNAITLDGNSDMRPDFMWHKEQNDTNGWHQFDSSRGVTKYLATQSTGAEGTFGGYLTSFDSNGFTANYGDSSMNSSGTAQCSWMWHCNGGTTSSNTDGSMTSTVQANQDAGFSIVTYTGTGSAATVGHGLSVAPKVIIVKARTGVPTSWAVFHKDGSTSDDDVFVLSSTIAKATYAGFWNNQYPSSSVFGISNDIWLNGNGVNYVAYCFAEKQGYSKFGSYVGNGNADGTFVYTGFKPAFVMVKNYSNSGYNWRILDSTRNTFNLTDLLLIANLGSAEFDGSTHGDNIGMDFLSNGFKQRTAHTSINGSGMSYIYMAFAENPFTTSTGIPTTAR
jgi:hypothetical protein